MAHKQPSTTLCPTHSTGVRSHDNDAARLVAAKSYVRNMIQKYNAAASAPSAALQISTGKPMELPTASSHPETQDTELPLSSPKKRVRFAIDVAESSAEPDEDMEWVMVDVDARPQPTADRKKSWAVLQAYNAFLSSRRSAFWPGR
ncbi:hypothetical protein LTS09_001419 [Friedmanniomyces endolithicus]|nr:hypothetical protein LTS09_001419 [Friedmanniomyces endolithicus]